LKCPPKWGFGGNFWERSKYIWWEPPRNETTVDLRIFRHVWFRFYSPCYYTAHSVWVWPFAIGENFGKFGGPQLSYQKSQENTAAGRHPLGPSTITWNKKLSCRRETARCFVFVCSQLQHTYSAVFYYQLLRLQIFVRKILLFLGYPMVKKIRRYFYSF